MADKTTYAGFGRRLLIGGLAALVGAGAARMQLGEAPPPGEDGAKAAVVSALAAKGWSTSVEQVAVLPRRGEPVQWTGTHTIVALAAAAPSTETSTSEAEAESRDIVALSGEITEEGVLISIEDVRPVATSPMATERLLGSSGPAALFAVQSGGEITGIVRLTAELRHQTLSLSPEGMWSAWLMLSGEQPVGLRREEVRLHRPGRIVTVLEGEGADVTRLEVDGQPVEISWTSGSLSPPAIGVLHQGSAATIFPKQWSHARQWVAEAIAELEGQGHGRSHGRSEPQGEGWFSVEALGERGRGVVSTQTLTMEDTEIYLVRVDLNQAQLHMVAGSAVGPEGHAGPGAIPEGHRDQAVALFMGPAEPRGLVSKGITLASPVADALALSIDAQGAVGLGKPSGVEPWGLYQGVEALLEDTAMDNSRQIKARCGALGLTEAQTLIYAWSPLASAEQISAALSAVGVVRAVDLGCSRQSGLAWAPGGASAPVVPALAEMEIEPAAWPRRLEHTFFYLTLPSAGRPDPGAQAAGIARAMERVAVDQWPGVQVLRIDPEHLTAHLIPGQGEPRPAEGAPTGLTLDRAPAAWLLLGAATSERGLQISNQAWTPLVEGACTVFADREGALRSGLLGTPGMEADVMGPWALQGELLLHQGRRHDVQVAAHAGPLYAAGVDPSGRLILVESRGDAVPDSAGLDHAGLDHAALALSSLGVLEGCVLGQGHFDDDPPAVRYFTGGPEGITQLDAAGEAGTLQLPPGRSSGLAFTPRVGPPRPRAMVAPEGTASDMRP
ncbi:MAG: hypothetical protein ACE366_06380 [Bradymonadia bacterium]